MDQLNGLGKEEAMLLPVHVKFERVPAQDTSTGQPGKTHLTVGGIAVCDDEWPWGHEREQAFSDDWTANPCKNCIWWLNKVDAA